LNFRVWITFAVLLLAPVPAWAHRQATAHEAPAGGISIPNIAHRQMAIVAAHKAAVLAERQMPTDPTASDYAVQRRRANCACFGFEALHKLTAIVPEIDLMLDGFSKERLTPRMVEEILGISSVERRQWTKDGRLPKSAAVVYAIGAPPQSFWRIDIAPLSITSFKRHRSCWNLGIRQLHTM
jgi:hypothetical protein